MNRFAPLALIVAVLLLAAVWLLLPEFKEPSPEIHDSEINVIVSILPQKEFVSAVGGDHVSVRELIPPGASPATYDPSPQDLIAIEEADMYFRVGYIPFEKSHIEAIQSTNPTLTIVDTSEGLKTRSIDGSGDGDIQSIDPHIWLSPSSVKQQVENVYSALAEMDPSNAAEYRANADAYLSRLDELDKELSSAFSGLNTTVLMVFHPAWGYLADDYGLVQIAIESEGKDPSPGELQGLIDLATEKDVKVIFVQEQFDESIAESVAEEIGAVVVQIDPLAEDYITNMASIGEVISSHLS